MMGVVSAGADSVVVVLSLSVFPEQAAKLKSIAAHSNREMIRENFFIVLNSLIKLLS